MLVVCSSAFLLDKVLGSFLFCPVLTFAWRPGSIVEFLFASCHWSYFFSNPLLCYSRRCVFTSDVTENFVIKSDDMDWIQNFKAGISAFFHIWINRLIRLILVIPMFDSVKTISWSLIPGMGTHLFMSDGRLERKRSRVFCSLVELESWQIE